VTAAPGVGCLDRTATCLPLAVHFRMETLREPEPPSRPGTDGVESTTLARFTRGSPWRYVSVAPHRFASEGDMRGDRGSIQGGDAEGTGAAEQTRNRWRGVEDRRPVHEKFSVALRLRGSTLVRIR
jgi:hypothetical protein